MTDVPDVGVGTTGTTGAKVGVMTGTNVATGIIAGDGVDGIGIIIGAIVAPIGIDTGAGVSIGPAVMGDKFGPIVAIGIKGIGAAVGIFAGSGTIVVDVGIMVGTFNGAFVGNNDRVVGSMTTGGVPVGAHVGTLLLFIPPPLPLLLPPPLPLLLPPPLPDFDFVLVAL